MKDDLEHIVETPPTLRQELKQSVRQYPKTWVEYMKTLGPACLISSVGSALSQWASVKMGYDSAAATTLAAYIGGYATGYSSVFGLEYLRHRQKYPRGILSKEFGEFVGTFLAADYVADLTIFSPSFIFANVWLAHHTKIHPATRSLLAWNSAAFLYILGMAALHPGTRRINQSINKGVISLYQRLISHFPSGD